MNMTRNFKIATSLLAGTAAVGCANAAPLSGHGKKNLKEKPNMVLIFIDDTGWGTFAPNIVDFNESDMNQNFINTYGSKIDYTYEECIDACKKAMPNLTRWCNDGIRFTNAYVTANVSSPSRAGLLTSSYQQRYGMYINNEAQKGIPTDIKLMPQVLKENGYATGIFGKYHNGQSVDKINTCAEGHHPLDRGFTKFFGFNKAGTDYYDSDILFEDKEHVHTSTYLTDKFTEKAIEFIKDNKGTPKLVYVPYNALHGPLGKPAPEKYASKFNYASSALNKYASYTLAFDEGVQQIMDTMKEIGELDNTILVFLTDNGAPGGTAQPLPKNGPFSGFKGQSYQGGYHVPMFIWYGNKIPQGVVCDQMVSSMDIFPTLFELAGIEKPAQPVDGVSLKPILDGDLDAEIHDHLVWMSQQAENWGMNKVSDQDVAQAAFMVREGDFVLRYVVEDDHFYLHNVTEDRKEEVDLSSKYPEKVEHMKGLFKDWFHQMKKPNEWKPELWQNVQYWDTTLPPAPEINRDPAAKAEKKATKAAKGNGKHANVEKDGKKGENKANVNKEGKKGGNKANVNKEDKKGGNKEAKKEGKGGNGSKGDKNHNGGKNKDNALKAF